MLWPWIGFIALVFTLLVYLVWSAVYAASPDQAIPYGQLITYVMIGQAIDFARDGAPERTLVFDTARAIRRGDIATDLVRPVDSETRVSGPVPFQNQALRFECLRLTAHGD